MSYTRFVMGCGLPDPLVYQPKNARYFTAITVAVKLRKGEARK